MEARTLAAAMPIHTPHACALSTLVPPNATS